MGKHLKTSGAPLFSLLGALLAVLCAATPAFANIHLPDQINYVETPDGQPALPTATSSGELELPSLEDATVDEKAEIDALRKAVEQDPNDSGSWHKLAELYQGQQEWDDARRAYRTYLDLVPIDTSAQIALANMLAGAAMYEDALGEYDHLSPDNATESIQRDIAAGYGMALVRTGHGEQAMPWLERALKHTPDDAQLRLAYADLLRSQGRFADAVPNYEQALAAPEMQGSTEARLGLARALAGAGRSAEAAAEVGRVYSRPEEYAPGQLAKAQILSEAGDKTNAVSAVDELLARDPKNAAALSLHDELVPPVSDAALVLAQAEPQPVKVETEPIQSDEQAIAAPAEPELALTPPAEITEPAAAPVTAEPVPTPVESLSEPGGLELPPLELLPEEPAVIEVPVEAPPEPELVPQAPPAEPEPIAQPEPAEIPAPPTEFDSQLDSAKLLLDNGEAVNAASVYESIVNTPGIPDGAHAKAAAGYALALRASGARGEAERWFIEALRLNPDDNDLRLAYVYTLAENRELDRAMYQLSVIERKAPGDQRTTLAAARAQAWNCNYAQALCYFDQVDDPALTGDALLGKAYAQYWMGHRSDARKTLASACGLLPASEEAARLHDLLSEKPRTSLAVTHRNAEDSEDNQYTGTMATLNIPVDADGSAVTISHESFTVENTGTGGKSSDGTNTRIEADVQLDDQTTLHGYAGQVNLDNGADPNQDHVDLGAALTHEEDDWSFSAGFSENLLYDTPKLARSGVTLKSLDLSTSFGLGGEDTKLTLNYSSGELSDSNKRQDYGFNLRRVDCLDGRGELGYGIQGRLLSYDQDLDHGYFDPDRYQLAEAYVDWVDMSDNRLKLDASLGLGVDKLGDADLRTIVRWAVGLRAELSDSFLIRAGVKESDEPTNAEQSGGDFHQRLWYVSGEWEF